MPLSAVDCVQPALQHTRQQLFNPFRWGQWSRLALVGILAAELHVGGCGAPNFNTNFPTPHKNGGQFSSLFAMRSGFPPFDPSKISAHLGQFLGLILFAVFAFIVLMFVFLYINSVFRFILFDSVVRRECSIGEGWNKYHRAGLWFFLWQLVLMVSVWLLIILIGVPVIAALAAGWGQNLKEHIGRLFAAIFLFGGFFVCFFLAIAVVQALAKDFLVPIMALENLDFAAAWRRLLVMIRPEKGKFAVYLLLKFVLAIAAAILFSILAIIPMIFVVIPGVIAFFAGKAAGIGWNVTGISLAIIFGSVLLAVMIYLVALVCVPGTIFFPAYAMYFLASRYPELDALLHPAPPQPEPSPQAPPITEPPPPQTPPPVTEPPPFEPPPFLPPAEPAG